MADRQFHIGERVGTKVTMFDSAGRETDNYDKASGIQTVSTDPGTVVEAPTDQPKDIWVSFTALTPPGENQTLHISFDGDPGDGVRSIELVSETYEVVEGEAVSGELSPLKLAPV